MSAARKGKPKSQEHKAAMSAAHKGFITSLNIETGEVHNISTELYHSRRDIYFHNSSKVYKNWKAKHSRKETDPEAERENTHRSPNKIPGRKNLLGAHEMKYTTGTHTTEGFIHHQILNRN